LAGQGKASRFALRASTFAKASHFALQATQDKPVDESQDKSVGCGTMQGKLTATHQCINLRTYQQTDAAKASTRFDKK